MSKHQRFILYDNPAQAYRHLLTDEYAAYTVRPEGQRVVVFYPQTMTARLFDKLETVGNWYAWSIYEQNVFTQPKHLSVKFSDKELIEAVLHFDKDADVDEKTSLQLAESLFNLLQKHGNLVTREKPQMDAVSEDSDKYMVNLDKLCSEDFAKVIDKMPKQCRIIANELKAEKISAYTVEELESFARRLHISGKLKTKQDPFRIVRYYAPELGKHGVMEYRSRRVREDSDAPSEDSD